VAVIGFESLPGTAFTPGSFTISAAENVDLLAAIEAGVASDPGLAHPIWAYFATQRGIGASVADICALADFDVADGPMLGSVEVDYLAPLALDTEYRVTGQALGIDRKVGAKTGTFDILAYQLALEAPDGTTVATVTNTFILPRRELT
jgi:hypothetical protein